MRKIGYILFCLLYFGASSRASRAQPPRSPAPPRAIICLTYDDGLPSHLTTVLPQLDSAAITGTFFLNAIAGAATVLGQPSFALIGWRTAARHGHELANHTLFHACPEQLGWPKAFAIESYTVAQLLIEIQGQNTLLAALDPTRQRRAFAYPCNNSVVGGLDYAPLLRKRKLVSFGRVGGTRASAIATGKSLDPMKVPSWLVEEGTTASELIAFAQQVQRVGGLGVYQFHGVGGEFFQISAASHRALLAYLKAHPAHYQVLTFSQAMETLSRK